MFAGRQVPWVDWRDWQDTRARLFSEDEDECRSGIHQVCCGARLENARTCLGKGIDCMAGLRMVVTTGAAYPAMRRWRPGE